MVLPNFLSSTSPTLMQAPSMRGRLASLYLAELLSRSAQFHIVIPLSQRQPLHHPDHPLSRPYPPPHLRSPSLILNQSPHPRQHLTAVGEQRGKYTKNA